MPDLKWCGESQRIAYQLGVVPSDSHPCAAVKFHGIYPIYAARNESKWSEMAHAIEITAPWDPHSWPFYIFWAKSWPESSPTHPTHLSPSPQLPPRSPWLTVSRRSQAGHVMGQAWWDLKFTLLDSLVLLQDGVEKQKTKVISWCKSTKRCEFQTIVRDSWVPSCLLILSFCIKIWRLADCRTHFDIVSVTI